jgi:hypothetical protein
MGISSSSSQHVSFCGCSACFNAQQDDPSKQASSTHKPLAYVAPIAGGNGDGAMGLNAAIAQLKMGDQFDWRDGTAPAITVTYSYAYANWQFGDNTNIRNGAVMNTAQKAATERAIGQWESVANIR